MSLLLWELLLLGATAADWHGLLSFITDTSKLAAFWEMSSVGLFSGVTGTTSVKTLFLVLFPSEKGGHALMQSPHSCFLSSGGVTHASVEPVRCLRGSACQNLARPSLVSVCSCFLCEAGNCLIRLTELVQQKWQHWCVTGAPLHYITAVLLG